MAWTQGERQEVTRIVSMTATLEERLSHCDRRLVELVQGHKENSHTLNESCKKYELDLAELKRDIHELKQWKDELKSTKTETTKWLRTFWPPLVAVVLSVLLAPLGIRLWNYVGIGP